MKERKSKGGKTAHDQACRKNKTGFIALDMLVRKKPPLKRKKWEVQRGNHIMRSHGAFSFERVFLHVRDLCMGRWENVGNIEGGLDMIRVVLLLQYMMISSLNVHLLIAIKIRSHLAPLYCSISFFYLCY